MNTFKQFGEKCISKWIILNLFEGLLQHAQKDIQMPDVKLGWVHLSITKSNEIRASVDALCRDGEDER